MAFDAYMVVGDGTKIKGEATATDIPKGAFEIFSFSWGASNPTTVGSHGGGLTAGKVSISSFNVMKRADIGSPFVLNSCCTGEHHPTAQVILRKAAGSAGKQGIFIQYDFTDVMVESVQWSGSGGGDDTPTESVSFAFATVKYTYNVQDTKTGEVKKGSEATWDLTKVAK